MWLEDEKRKKKSGLLAAHVGCFSYNLYRLFLTPHSFSVTIFTLGFRLFFYSAANKPPLSTQTAEGDKREMY